MVEASKPFHKAIRADRPCLRTTLTLERITSENLAKAIAAAWQIFPHETHAEGFWPEITYKMAIEQQNPRFAYYLARDTEKIVGSLVTILPNMGSRKCGSAGLVCCRRSDGEDTAQKFYWRRVK